MVDEQATLSQLSDHVAFSGVILARRGDDEHVCGGQFAVVTIHDVIVQELGFCNRKSLQETLATFQCLGGIRDFVG